jgi:signal transduction histidine kinase/HPt (histidine-containing phosphotransfer) domain-containing protein
MSAILAVVALVAVAAYVGLSRHERRSLMLAKEKAAVMVAQLFATNLSAPLTFDDATGVAESVASLSSNPEIEFGAAWALDSAQSESLGARLGTLSRTTDQPQPPRSVPRDIRSRFTPTHVVVEMPVKDPNGKLVGAAQLAFSTAREEALIAQVERHVLWLSTGSALGLMFILSLASRVVVVRPLRRLTGATAALQRGEKPQLAIGTRDELGELAQAFMTMSVAIENREQQIRDRNRDMLRILDNADDAFITVSRAGSMSDERSKILERWFGSAEGPGFLDYFARICPEQSALMDLSWEALVENYLPLEVVLDQFPKRFARDDRHFQLRYRVIAGPSVPFESLLVVIHDATEAMKRGLAERRETEMLAIFRQIMADADGWDEFFDGGSRMVKRLAGADRLDEVSTRRLVHTLKGNCAVMGLESMAQLLHELEDRFDEGPAQMSADEVQTISQRWEELRSLSVRLGAGTGRSRSIAISVEEHKELSVALEHQPQLTSLARRVASWRHEPVSARLERLRKQFEQLSRRLGKGEPTVIVEPSALRLPAEAFADFWTVLAHVVRNSVDHGFQTAQERSAAGKNAANEVRLQAFADEDRVVVSISDDGCGIDWKKVARKATYAGLPAATRADLEQALYADSFSTRDEVSENSGRGIGLGAVRNVVTSLGGRIEIESAVGRGTTMRFVLPWFLGSAGGRSISSTDVGRPSSPLAVRIDDRPPEPSFDARGRSN